jgi:hypothetical protein
VKKQSLRRLVLHRETLTSMDLNRTAGGTGTEGSNCNISSCAMECSGVSVCWARQTVECGQTRPLCE